MLQQIIEDDNSATRLSGPPVWNTIANDIQGTGSVMFGFPDHFPDPAAFQDTLRFQDFPILLHYLSYVMRNVRASSTTRMSLDVRRSSPKADY